MPRRASRSKTRLADAPEDSHVALGAQAADGSIRTAIVADEWMAAFSKASGALRVCTGIAHCSKAISRPPPAGTLALVRADNRTRRVRSHRPGRDDRGRSGQCRRAARGTRCRLAGTGERAPRSVRVDAAGASAPFLEQARARTRIEFIAGTPWRWADAPPAAFASAIDLMSGRYGAAPPAPALDAVRLLRPALCG